MSNTPHSICVADYCTTKILPNTKYCPIHRALNHYEATPPNIERERLECTNCHKRTIRTEAEDRNFNTGKCAYCGGELAPVPNIEREELEGEIRHDLGGCLFLNKYDRNNCGHRLGTESNADVETKVQQIMVAVDEYVEQAVKEAEERGFQKAENILRQAIVNCDQLILSKQGDGSIFVEGHPERKLHNYCDEPEHLMSLVQMISAEGSATPHQKEEGGE